MDKFENVDAPPPRRPRWAWGVLAGVLLLGTAALPCPAAAPQEPIVEAPPAPELAAASAALRDAEPLFREIAETLRDGDPRDLAARMDRVEQLLRNAQDVYDRLRNRAPDPETIDRRLAVLDELLEALKEGRSRIRVPLARKLHREAVLLAKVALDGFQPYSREAHALDAKAEDAAGKLREARKLYVSIRNDVPDPEPLDRRIQSIDALLDRLEKRFPSIPSAN